MGDVDRLDADPPAGSVGGERAHELEVRLVVLVEARRPAPEHGMGCRWHEPVERERQLGVIAAGLLTLDDEPLDRRPIQSHEGTVRGVAVGQLLVHERRGARDLGAASATVEQPHRAQIRQWPGEWHQPGHEPGPAERTAEHATRGRVGGRTGPRAAHQLDRVELGELPLHAQDDAHPVAGPELGEDATADRARREAREAAAHRVSAAATARRSRGGDGRSEHREAQDHPQERPEPNPAADGRTRHPGEGRGNATSLAGPFTSAHRRLLPRLTRGPRPDRNRTTTTRCGRA